MAPKLYKMDLYPPVGSIYLTAEAVELTLDYQEIKLSDEYLLRPQFMMLKPQHVILSLEDNEQVIRNSHAINVYLATKYGKDDSLYPKDLYKRAIVNERLHFDSEVLFPLFKTLIRHIITEEVTTIPRHFIHEVNEAYEFLEGFLGAGNLWTAGDRMTVADFNLLSSALSLDLLVPIKLDKFPRIDGWIKRIELLPFYYVFVKNHYDFRQFIRNFFLL